MGASVHELKHAAKLQEWSAKVAECRGSGSGVKAWCAEHSISLKTYYGWERQTVIIMPKRKVYLGVFPYHGSFLNSV